MLNVPKTVEALWIKCVLQNAGERTQLVLLVVVVVVAPDVDAEHRKMHGP